MFNRVKTYISTLNNDYGMSIEIREIENDRQLNAFIGFPYQLYKDHPYYVPQLKSDTAITLNRKKNPAFEYCEAKYWLAYAGDKIVGRIAGIINHIYIKKWNNRYMRFGWIDFENDATIARQLLMQVEAWAEEKGLDAIHGPLGFTNFDSAGMLVDGFDQLGTFATIYNYPYYPLLMEKAGYNKDVDWVEYKIKVPQAELEKIKKVKTIVQQRLGLNMIKPGGTKEILSYSEKIFNLINSTYADLYGMVPLSEKQIKYYIKKYLSFLRPDFISLITDAKDELVAFGITMPSLSNAMQKAKGRLFPFGLYHVWKAYRKNTGVDLLLVAVRKDFQGKGVNGLLMHDLAGIYIKNGVEYAESNPELEQNKKVQSIWEHYESVQHKRRRCYIKYLHSLPAQLPATGLPEVEQEDTSRHWERIDALKAL